MSASKGQHSEADIAASVRKKRIKIVIGFIVGVVGVALATSAMLVYKNMAAEYESLIENWERAPIMEVAVVSAGSSMTSGFTTMAGGDFSGAQGAFPGADSVCDCRDSLDADFSGLKNGVCSSNATQAGCDTETFYRESAVKNLNWFGHDFGYTTDSQPLLSAAIHRERSNQDGQCPSGFITCGEGEASDTINPGEVFCVSKSMSNAKCPIRDIFLIAGISAGAWVPTLTDGNDGAACYTPTLPVQTFGPTGTVTATTNKRLCYVRVGYKVVDSGIAYDGKQGSSDSRVPPTEISSRPLVRVGFWNGKCLPNRSKKVSRVSGDSRSGSRFKCEDGATDGRFFDVFPRTSDADLYMGTQDSSNVLGENGKWSKRIYANSNQFCESAGNCDTISSGSSGYISPETFSMEVTQEIRWAASAPRTRREMADLLPQVQRLASMNTVLVVLGVLTFLVMNCAYGFWEFQQKDDDGWYDDSPKQKRMRRLLIIGTVVTNLIKIILGIFVILIGLATNSDFTAVHDSKGVTDDVTLETFKFFAEETQGITINICMAILTLAITLYQCFKLRRSYTEKAPGQGRPLPTELTVPQQQPQAPAQQQPPAPAQQPSAPPAQQMDYSQSAAQSV